MDTPACRVEFVEGVRNEVKRFFKEKFKESLLRRPRLEGISFDTLTREEADRLEERFTKEVIEEAVNGCDSDKCPGPDGYNFKFRKKCWSILYEDIFNFIDEFYSKANLPKAVLASFLSLIPKVDNPQNFEEFRPISLVDCLYKIIAKMFSNRLKKVITRLVSKCQKTFIPGRQIQYGVVVPNELVDMAVRGKRRCILLKVDFEKAYDNVNWKFLLDILKRCGFRLKWLSWIKACVCNSSMSVLVNSCSSKDFVVEKGLRQGDPLSLFLFTLVAEGLAWMMSKVSVEGLFEGFKVDKNVKFDLLQFPDDTIIIGGRKLE